MTAPSPAVPGESEGTYAKTEPMVLRSEFESLRAQYEDRDRRLLDAIAARDAAVADAARARAELRPEVVALIRQTIEDCLYDPTYRDADVEMDALLRDIATLPEVSP